MNHLQRLVLKFPNQLELIPELCENKNITLQFIISNPHIKWKCSRILSNISITKSDLRYILGKQFILHGDIIDTSIIKLSNEHFGYLDKALFPLTHRIDGYYQLIITDPSHITITDLETDNAGKYFLRHAPRNVVIKYFNKLPANKKHKICINSNLTINDLEEMKINIDYELLSCNTNINLDYIIKHKDKQWKICNLFTNEGLSLEDIYWIIEEFNILENKHLSYILFARNDLTIKFIEYLVIKYDRNHIKFITNIASSPSFDFKDLSVLKKLIPKIDYEYFSFNPNLTYEDVINNPTFPWNWELIAQNKFEPLKNNSKLQISSTIHTILVNEKRIITPICEIIISYTLFIFCLFE
jgi:hypothetical protein